MKNEKLMEKSRRSRIYSLVSIFHAESGHPGGVLSSVDILTYLFEIGLNYSRKTIPEYDDDRFVLSKGHAAPALYAVAAEAGIIDRSELNSLRKLGSKMQGHPDRNSAPWVEASTGSLGQGFSYAIGEAKGFRMKNRSNRVYALLGDGELQEGEVWEGAMFAGHYGLSNLCAIIDYNKMQSDDLNKNIMTLEPLADKWKAFNWNVIEIDGHNYDEIEKAFVSARRCENKPTVIIAHTIKGKGVSYMEGIPAWHGSVKLTDENLNDALQDLGVAESEMEVTING